MPTHPPRTELTYAQLKTILDNSYDEIYVFDGQGIILYANEACERNYNLKVADIIGASIYDCYEQYEYDPFLSPIVLHEKKRITLEHRSNTGKKLVITATPVLDDLGRIEMVIMNTRDLEQLTRIKHDMEECRQLSQLYYDNSGITPQESACLGTMVSQSPCFLRCVETVRQVAPSTANVLFLGETGTGKTLMAKFLHQNSAHRQGPFLAVNCAAIPEHLLESELFGYKKGSFTGAATDKPGIFALAQGGTLFLDEIGEIPLHIQAKLLQVIQEKCYLPLGDTRYHTLNTRIVSATNQNLGAAVAQGRFRSDLYYRLNVIEITLPPLRERLGDIPNLARDFLARFNEEYKTYHVLDDACWEVLEAYSWPGNIRQLQNFMERLVLMAPEERIMRHHLPASLLAETGHGSAAFHSPLDTALAQLEAELVQQAYQQEGSSRRVAQALGISQSRASRLLRKHGFSSTRPVAAPKKNSPRKTDC